MIKTPIHLKPIRIDLWLKIPSTSTQNVDFAKAVLPSTVEPRAAATHRTRGLAGHRLPEAPSQRGRTPPTWIASHLARSAAISAQSEPLSSSSSASGRANRQMGQVLLPLSHNEIQSAWNSWWQGSSCTRSPREMMILSSLEPYRWFKAI